MKCWRGIFVLLVVAACSPNTGGQAGGPLGLGPDGTGEPTTTRGGPGGSGPPAESGGGVDPDDGGPGPQDTGGSTGMGTTGSEPGTTTGGQSALEISHGPLHDFGNLDVGSGGSNTFIVTNIGSTAVADLDGMPLSDPFSYTGRGFPGQAGDCASVLESQASCRVEIRFSPTALGQFLDTLVLTHDQGESVRGLRGGGAGQGDNLLSNPGGEMAGNPPPGWTNAGAGNWEAGDPWDGQPAIFVGDGYLGAYNGPNNMPFLLEQTVDVSAWANTVDQGSGAMRFTFGGEAVSFTANNDPYRLQMLYEDDNGSELGVWSSDWHSTTMWQHVETNALAPTGTRSIRVQLGCVKTGSMYCDAFFDALELRATYP